MKALFRHRWLAAIGLTMLAAVIMLLVIGAVYLTPLVIVFAIAALAASYPSLQERRWQSRYLPAGSVHVPAARIQKGNNEYDLLQLFEIPQVFQWIKNRYTLRAGDPGAPGVFLYIFLPPQVYDNRNIGADTVYKVLAEKLKLELQDTSSLDLIAQRNLPLSFGYRFLNKDAFPFYEFSKSIDVVKKDYYRENTKIRGVLQSRRRMFRIHSPEDDEWRTFAPFQEPSQLLYGSELKASDFRSNAPRSLRLDHLNDVQAERVDYHESIPFGSLLTYAKKGEISLDGSPDAVDRLYIDKLNVLVQGPEYRKEILETLSRQIGREFADEDFYALFNYGQRLRGYLDAGRSISDFISSHGNFALYYDPDKGWTIYRLQPGLKLRLQETFFSAEPKDITGSLSLATSRAKLFTGSADSLLQFNISTGTPTRGRIFTADDLIEGKIKQFAALNQFKLLGPTGTGAEGCTFLAQKNGTRFFIKSPDGQLAEEEMRTIENLKSIGCIPSGIRTYQEERIIVAPEYPSVSTFVDGNRDTALSLLFEYLGAVWQAGYLSLDLSPDHVRIEPAARKLFLIDFSGYVLASRFSATTARELLADRKKIEYRTPEEVTGDFSNPEKFQIYLMGLLIHQLLRTDQGLPSALQALDRGAEAYNMQLDEDLKEFSRDQAEVLRRVLRYAPAERMDFAGLRPFFASTEKEISDFWKDTSSRLGG